MFFLRSLSFQLRILALLFAIPAVTSAAEPAGLAFFYPGQTEENLVLPLCKATPSARLEYRIKNYAGDVVTTGQIATDEKGNVRVPAGFSPGYYELLVSTGKKEETFPFLRLPALPSARGSASDTGSSAFFGMDAALSWLLSPELRAERIAQLPQVVRGGLVRERLSWNAVHTAPSVHDWETSRQYETVRRLYADNGLKVLEMFHDAPSWLGKAQNGKYPLDLPAAARSFREIAQRWQSYWGALEAWNEPDIGYSAWQPADQYVPLVKTLRYTLRSSGLNTPIAGGVFAYLNADFMAQASASGLLDEIDICSFHYYNDALLLEKRVADVRAWLAAAGHESKPIWITEMGRRWRGDKSVMPALDLQRDTARNIAMQAVEARACGVAGWFPFVYPVYNEGQNNFGLTDRRGLPMRPLAAVAQISRVLDDTSYLGDLVPTPDASTAKTQRVFETNDSGQVLVVVYTDDAPSSTNITLPFAAVSAQGVDGRALDIKTGEKSTVLQIPDGIIYIYASKSAVEPFLRTDTEAMRLTRQARKTPSPLPKPAPVVLQTLIDLKASNIRAVTRGYLLPEGDSVRVPVALRVNNLAESSHVVSVTYPLKDGSLSAPCEVTVNGGAFKEIAFDIDPATLPENSDGIRTLTFAATSATVERIAPAALTLMPYLGLDGYLARYAYQFSLPAGDLQRWQHNANGKLTFGHESPGAIWGFHVHFHGGDRWAYPRFSLPQEVDSDRVVGVLIRARCAQPAIVRVMSWDDANEQSVTSAPVFPADGKWSVIYLPLSAWIKPRGGGSEPLGRQLKNLSLGINSLQDENFVEVSDMYLLGH